MTMKTLVPLDKYGWPVERFRNRPITNAIRLMLHTRRIVTRAEWKRREALLVGGTMTLSSTNSEGNR